KGGTAYLLSGTRAIAEPLPGSAPLAGCPPRMLVLARQMTLLGSGADRYEVVLRLPYDIPPGPLERLRFQVLEFNGDIVRTSNGVVWTVRR
ncbi:MAG: hypothetical protein AB1486_31715, partial [Planctomycetota bacterium]